MDLCLYIKNTNLFLSGNLFINSIFLLSKNIYLLLCFIIIHSHFYVIICITIVTSIRTRIIFPYADAVSFDPLKIVYQHILKMHNI